MGWLLNNGKVFQNQQTNRMRDWALNVYNSISRYCFLGDIAKGTEGNFRSSVHSERIKRTSSEGSQTIFERIFQKNYCSHSVWKDKLSWQALARVSIVFPELHELTCTKLSSSNYDCMQDFAELQQNVAQAQRKQDLMNEATDRN